MNERTPEPPARQIARSSRQVLERVMLNLSQLPARVPRGPVLASIGQALSAIIALEKSDLDHQDHLELLRAAAAAAEKAHGQVERAEPVGHPTGLQKSVLEVATALKATIEPTIDILVKTQDLAFRKRVDIQAPVRSSIIPFKTSVGVPHLFAWERPPLSTEVRLPLPPSPAREEAEKADDEPLPEGDPTAAPSLESFNSDADNDNAGDAADKEDAEDESSLERELNSFDAFSFSAEKAEQHTLAEITRDLGEEVGALGLLRSPVGPNVPWAIGPAAFEARLLHSLDAFMSLAEPVYRVSTPVSAHPTAITPPTQIRFDLLRTFLEWAGDAMVPDPTRAFARAFLLGSIDGEDTARAAVLALRQSHPLTYEAQRDALTLVPHPSITHLVERLLVDETGPLLEVGLNILERRREGSFEAVAPLLSHPSRAVRRAAAKTLAVTSPPRASLDVLQAHAKTEEDDAVLAAAAEALLTLGSRVGLTLVRERLTEELTFPGALTKPVRAEFLLLLGIAGGPSDSDLLISLLRRDPAAANALGFFGDALLVPPMITTLAEVADLPAHWELAKNLASALHRITGKGRTAFTPPETPDPLVEPSQHPSHWVKVWEEHKNTFQHRKKYRYGASFTPLSSTREAALADLPIVPRKDILLELTLASQGKSRVHEDDWVSRQQLALGEMKDFFRPGLLQSYPEGQWLSAALT
ncbi:MAG: HEAT repeat domain-containing protein [Polyangiaceae bacterium]|nr:HEAT repeat domain-containing protein [Polyangiaceae bacterium]